MWKIHQQKPIDSTLNTSKIINGHTTSGSVNKRVHKHRQNYPSWKYLTIDFSMWSQKARNNMKHSGRLGQRKIVIIGHHSGYISGGGFVRYWNECHKYGDLYVV